MAVIRIMDNKEFQSQYGKWTGKQEISCLSLDLRVSIPIWEVDSQEYYATGELPEFSDGLRFNPNMGSGQIISSMHINRKQEMFQSQYGKWTVEHLAPHT